MVAVGEDFSVANGDVAARVQLLVPGGRALRTRLSVISRLEGQAIGLGLIAGGHTNVTRLSGRGVRSSALVNQTVNVRFQSTLASLKW